jgi:site-specific DNA-methyltransferase (adenine-specific)
MMGMVTKILQRMEVERGFIQIPVKLRSELIGDSPLPCSTLLNGSPAQLDKYARLRSPYLKNRFPVGAEIELTKTDEGYRITTVRNEAEPPVVLPVQQEAALPALPATAEDTRCRVLEGDCLQYLSNGSIADVSLTFLDPPYRQGKEYRFFDDNQSASKYWSWMTAILRKVYDATVDGGAVYFMQREKNAEQVLKVLRKTGWKLHNLIIWKKKTSAVPVHSRYSKQYQIIAYAIKGERPKVFNKLRIDLPALPEHKYERENGVYVTDVWDDIRELTSGYFAGDEAIRDKTGNRTHEQQSPVALLLRIILSSTLPGDLVLDPLAGTGTTVVVANQLERNSIGIEIDPENVKIINNRLRSLRPSDSISRHCDYYRFTANLREIWPLKKVVTEQKELA